MFRLTRTLFLENVDMRRYKILSGEVSNIPMLREVAKTGKPVILSSGVSPWSDIDLAVSTLHYNGCTKKLDHVTLKLASLRVSI
jgi:N,N'-diacetyllegionaminate synthase